MQKVFQESSGKMLAALVRDELRQARFESLADLTDAVKTRCARLRIPFDADAFNAAYALVGSNLPLVTPPPPAPREPEPEPPVITRTEAPAILAELRARLGMPAVRTMPKARLVTPGTADQHKAMAIVLAQIADTAARCDELELRGRGVGNVVDRKPENRARGHQPGRERARMTLEFTVLGVAQQMGSKRAFVPKGWTRPVITDSNRNLKTWQVLVSEAAHAAIRRLPRGAGVLSPRDTGIRVSMTAYLPRPTSLPKRITAHTKAPDLDKLVRGLGDALTAIAFHDDAQIDELVAAKRYAGPGESARIVVRIEPSGGAVPRASAPLFATA